MNNDAMSLILEGKDILFTFRSEAEEFARKNKLEIEIHECEFDDEDHILVKGYGAKLYWIAR